jgi:hypothetical protein
LVLSLVFMADSPDVFPLFLLVSATGVGRTRSTDPRDRQKIGSNVEKIFFRAALNKVRGRSRHVRQPERPDEPLALT